MLNEAFDSLDKYEKKPLGNDFSRNVRTLYKAKQAISNSTFIRECQLNGNMDGALKGIDSNEILNSLYSASRIMEKRQSNELVTIGDIMAEFRRFAEAVPDRTDGMARKLDDLYGKLYEEHSSVLKNIRAQFDRGDFPSDEEIKTARQTLTANNNPIPRTVSDFMEEISPTKEIKTQESVNNVIKETSLSQEEYEAKVAEISKKSIDEWYQGWH